MLGKRNPQSTIFDGDQKYAEHVGAKTLYGFLARERHNLFRDEDFAALYDEKLGRPSVPPSLLCVALVLQAFDKTSDAEARDRAKFDLRWKVALGIAEKDSPFTKSTLQLFRAQLLCNDEMMQLFTVSVEAAKKAGLLKSAGKLRLAVDTTNILGRGAVRDTYNLLADGILAVMRLLARSAGQPIEEWAQKHGLEAYLASSIKSEADLDWSDPAEKQAFLGVLVEDAKKVLELGARRRQSLEAGSPEDDRLVKASEILNQVLLQDVEPASTNEDGTPKGRGKKIVQGTSGDRICSVTDPEMRHGRKSAHHRFDGHKLSVATDVESQVIVAVDVMAGSAPDDQGSLELAQQGAANTGLELEAVLGDCAYGSGDNRERFTEAGVELLAKVPRRSNGDFFSKDAFAIDTEAITCVCPAGEMTSDLVRAGTDKNRAGETIQVLAFAFGASVCAACPLRDQCFKVAVAGKPPTRGRQVRINPHEVTMQAAKAWQQSPDFDLFRKQRQVVEHRIARMTQLGVRQARYFGRHKTLFQVLMAATVANLTLVMARTNSQETPGASLQGLRALLSALFRALSPLQSTNGRFGGPPNLWRIASCAGLQ